MRSTLTLLLACLLLLPAHAQTTAPTAQDDTFSVIESDTLLADVGVLLLNDNQAEGDSLVAILLQGPSNGTLTLQRDGSFSYIPNAGFTGTDSFTYAARTTNFLPEVFTVDSTQSTITFTVSLSTIFGSGTDTDVSPVRGSIVADVTPNTSPFTDVHTTALDLELIEGLALSYNWGIFNAAGLDMNTEPGAMRLSFAEAGAPTTIAQDTGLFSQDNNEMNFQATVSLGGTGLLSALIPSSTAALDTTFATSFGGILSQSDEVITMESPFELTNTFEIDGLPVDLTIDGDIIATADAYPIFDSQAATVSIEVRPASNVATEDVHPLAQPFTLAPNYPNPFAGTTTLSYSITEPAHLRLAVVDLLGRTIDTLVDGSQAPGTYTVAFDATDLPSGLYFYRLEANDVLVQARTMTVMK